MSYVYTISVDEIVRYVGKGQGSRAHFHTRIAARILKKREHGLKVKTTFFYNKLCSAIVKNRQIFSVVVIDNLSEKEAFALEIEAISSFPAGQLWNDTAGGDGITSEDTMRFWKNNDERKRALSERTVKMWEERRAEITATLRQVLTDPLIRAKLSADKKKRWEDPIYREQMSKMVKEKSTTPEARAARSKRIKVRWEAKTPEEKEFWSSRHSEIMKKKWQDPVYRQRRGYK